ncbi:ThuA domain-containing protein [Streptomyces sp. MAR4 CNX-425]|uniref:ThuA domain-containing protein n=1 Tax=Streptomyces sp. MAR4 CNX-425 TaxID=3406343 RepID=UPI003B5053F0
MHKRRLRRYLSLLTAGLLAGPALLLSTSSSQAAPLEPAAAAPEFQQVPLAKGDADTGEPMTMAMLPDNSVLHTSRDGTVRLTTAAGATGVAGKLDVYSHDEEGLQGVGVDPGFADNRFVYLYYAPSLDTPAGDAPETGTAADFAPFDGVNRLSRFVLKDDGTLDMGSEKKVLDVPASRGVCCHVGGDIDFDADGNLYLSTGDDTNPFQSGGYSPLDERADRNPAFDAQRSSANTNDLRGKILRIKVNADGSYDIPEGNLFEPGMEKTRPEIYAMGFRNPFRFTVDKPTGTVYVGDYGPDAGAANPDRGPAGQVEFARVTEAGNYGWPYCTGANDAYQDYDFGSGTSGAAYDCAAPVNDSPHNTGLTELPPAQAAWIPYNGGSVPEFGDGSESPMGGPVYREAETDPGSEVKFPAEWDGDFFAGEYGRQWIKRIEQGGDGTVQSINDFPWTGTQVMDMDFGSDGALYVLDYGTSPDTRGLYRIENITGGRSPIAAASADVTSGQAPLDVRFSAEGTTDPDSTDLTYAWDFGDGATSDQPDPAHTYAGNGTYDATLTVTDPGGLSGTADVRVVVGNTAPTVKLDLPENGRLFSFGDDVPFEVTVTDPEDGDVDCSKVEVTYGVGHDSHVHDLTSANGCSGTIDSPADGEHDPNANLYGSFTATYTDGGGGGQGALTGTDTSVAQPRHRQAEHYTDSQGVKQYNKTPAHGGKTVGDIHNGDWIAFEPYVLSNATEFTARISSAGDGGTLEVRAGAPDGKLLGSAEVPVTGGWETFQDVTAELSDAPAGTTKLYLVFQGTDGPFLFDVDDFTFTTGSTAEEDENVLVFSKTAGFRHDSIPEGIAAIEELGAENGFGVDATEDGGAFTAENLEKYEAVVFLSTTGDVLDAEQQQAFEDYVAGGGGYVGVHSAADSEYDWEFYGGLVGAYFDGHPAIQEATVTVEDRKHPATEHLDRKWVRTDEWYNYRTNPREQAHVLATLDESSYDGGTMGEDHPIAWCQSYEGGRAFYTGGGHTKESYTEPAFRAHLLGGIQYAAGAAEGDCDDAKPGYSPIFDGTSTEGWQQTGPGSFRVEDGTLVSEGGTGLLWYEAEEFGAYSLKLDWKTAGDDNSGVFVGFPPPAGWEDAMDNGYEVQIDATDSDDRTTGAIYGVQAPDTAVRDRVLNPPGEWNTYEIRVEGERLRVFLNGEKINDFTNTDPVRSLTDGHVGIQNHGEGDEVAFRNIRVKELR